MSPRDNINRKRDGETPETATGQKNKPAIDTNGDGTPDAHGSAAANVIADADAGADPREKGGAGKIENMPEKYRQGEDAAKDKKPG